jgi:methyltransferase (TIGR00027 family)
VLPAAGMDARAYRLSWPDGTVLFELDHPESLAIKGQILKRQSLAPKCKRVTIGTDLNQDWARLVVDPGFAAHEASMWLIEGLFYYLDELAENHVLKEISGLAVPNSMLVTDLVSPSLLANPWMQPALKSMEEQGMGWRFGTDDPAALFAKHGWEAETKEPGVEGVKYDPRRFPNQPCSSWSFFVVARRAYNKFAAPIL